MPRQRNPGRVRWRLSELLLAKGIIVSPYDLWGQEGAHRSAGLDLARWGSYEATFVNGTAPDGTKWVHKIHLSSWSTMSDCVRYGIAIGPEDNLWNHVSVEHAEST